MSIQGGAPPALPALLGRRVVLRQPVPADIAARLEVPADPEAHRMYGGSGEPRPVTRAGVEAGLARVTSQDPAAGREFVVAALAWPDGRPSPEPAGRYIGHARLHAVSWEERHARLAIGLYDRRFWSRGYGTEAVRLLLRYGFEALGLHRIALSALEYNARAIRCYEKCGFVREGLARDSALVDGVWWSDVLMSILEPEYRAQPWVSGLPG